MMPDSAPSLIHWLIGALLLLSSIVLYLQLRMGSAGRNVDPARLAVLEERLQSRENEINALKEELAAERSRLQQEQFEGRGLQEKLSRQETLLQQERISHEEKLRLLQGAREQLTHEFKSLANEILEQKGKTFTENSRLQLQALLQPLGEKIQLFEKKVEDTYDKESKQRFALEREIKALLELNTRISVDAVNLTNALKGESKTQGIWGEVILERVLEKSGLTKGREYEVQVSLRDDDGKTGQPDVLVHLPEGKDVIIDAKVSLTAYQNYFAATEDADKVQLLRQHIQSIRNHIRGLSTRNYQHLQGVSSLDYVLLFLPVEAAFTLAVQHDESLFTEAFEKNIILVGPSTLLATLRTIQSIWRYEYQNKNAQEIAQSAGRLYDKFVAFCSDLDEIGKRLQQTQEAWDQARGKLMHGKGNLVGRTEKLRTLGARASKKLPGHWQSDVDAPDDDDSEA
jgi:DNA recombination protein RmuC